MNFAIFGPGYSTAECSAPCGPIRLKFYVVDGLGHGYTQCEFLKDALRYVSAAVEKPSKTDDFRCFWPGLTDGAADCSAPCGLIRLKFYVVDGLGHGYKQCEFRRDALRYMSAAVEKTIKNSC